MRQVPLIHSCENSRSVQICPSISIRSRTLLPIQIHAQKPGCSFGQTPNGDFIFEELCCKYAGLELWEHFKKFTLNRTFHINSDSCFLPWTTFTWSRARISLLDRCSTLGNLSDGLLGPEKHDAIPCRHEAYIYLQRRGQKSYYRS